MKRSKLFLFALVIALCSVFFCGINFKASEVMETNEISVLGASVRTSDPMGIRFYGAVNEATDISEVNAFGIAIAFGDVEKSEVVLGNTIGEYEVLSATVTALDEENQFYVSLVNIPEEMYGQKVTARAFIEVADAVIYADTVTVRSFNYVVKEVYESGTGNDKVAELYGELPLTTVNYNTDGGSLKFASTKEFLLQSYNGSSMTSGASNGVVSINNIATIVNKTWSRILIKYNTEVGMWESVGVGPSDTNAVGTTTATHAICSHSGNTDTTSRAIIDSICKEVKNGTKYYFDLGSFTSSNVPSGSSNWNQTAKAYISSDLEEQEIPSSYKEPVTLPTPTKSGYTFLGWRNSYDNGLYITFPGYRINPGIITFTAEWEANSTTYDGYIVGQFNDESWVVKGDKIQLSTTYVNSSSSSSLTWKSESPAIATVSSSGTVTGVSEGLAIINVYDTNNSSIKFTFYVTVFNEDPSGVLKLIVDSNNATVYTRDGLLIGITYGSDGAYYADLVGSVSQLLFESYVEHTSYYLANPSKTTAYTNGVEFITLHYAADMPYSASASLTGGKNLASYNQTASGASWHYSTGNDGIWACQNTAYGTWHAGSSKTMKWYATGVKTSQIGTNVYTTDVTLKSDNYFYIKGVKTSVTNTTGYSYTKLNKMGVGVKLVDDEWYIGGCYYSSDYGYISSLGGNNNSIGIESSVRKGSDLWLTWHYSAQLCAKLLDQFDLPIQRLVGHHFFSGKWCPQPMLENDLEIWHIFRNMVEQELSYRTTYSDYTLSFTSNSSYLKSNGRITSQPTYSECITYTVDYTKDGETKTVTLSSIIPGTTR